MSLLSKKSPAKKTGVQKVLSNHWLFTVYLALVCFVSIVVMAINLGVLITSFGKYIVISEEEYLLSNQVWEIRQCSEPKYKGEKVVKEKTTEEIATCEEEIKASAIARRSINLKEQFMASLAWFAVFGLLFWFHYPKFMATRREK